MAIIRRQDLWNPLRDLDELSNRVSQFLQVPRSSEALAMSDWAPSCDISETEDEYRVRVELPSVKRDDVNVTLENGVLTIQGERRSESEEKGEKYHRRELSYGSFVRSFQVPDDADPDEVDAKFKDGMLRVTLKKSEAKSDKPRQITIH